MINEALSNQHKKNSKKITNAIMKSVFYVIYVQHIFSSYMYSIIKLRITHTTSCDNIHMIMIFHYNKRLF